MTIDFETYFRLSCERFPENHYDKLIGHGWNRVDLIKKNAECLFIAGEMDSELANATRDQLVHLRSEGTINFKG